MKISALAFAALASTVLATSAIKAEPVYSSAGTANDACKHHIIAAGPTFAKDFRICAYLVKPLRLDYLEPASLSSAGAGSDQEDLSVIRAFIRAQSTGGTATD